MRGISSLMTMWISATSLAHAGALAPFETLPAAALPQQANLLPWLALIGIFCLLASIAWCGRRRPALGGPA